jgi:hypothetical protein
VFYWVGWWAGTGLKQHIQIHTEPIDLSGFEVLDRLNDTITISNEDPLFDFEEL